MARPRPLATTPGAARGEGADPYLALLGERVREERARRGMARRILARDSGLSERYLAQLEAGKGNLSISLLRRVAQALNLPLAALVDEGPREPAELRSSLELLRRLPPERLAEALALLASRFGTQEAEARRRRIALIGLRGAGKSTLGSRLGAHLGLPFVELDREIERDCGLSLGEIFALYDQSAYRRSEARALDRIVAEYPGFVLAAGGSVVAEPATFERLLASCFTVWVRASPEEHMRRVMAQGDFRPMAENREAMADLKRMLAVREPLYARADAVVDTAGQSIEAAFRRLLDRVPAQSCMKGPDLP